MPPGAGRALAEWTRIVSHHGTRLRSVDPALTAEQIDLIFTMDSVAPTRIASFLQVVLPRRGGVETPFWTSEGVVLLSSLFSLLLVASYSIASRIPPGQG